MVIELQMSIGFCFFFIFGKFGLCFVCFGNCEFGFRKLDFFLQYICCSFEGNKKWKVFLELYVKFWCIWLG